MDKGNVHVTASVSELMDGTMCRSNRPLYIRVEMDKCDVLPLISVLMDGTSVDVRKALLYPQRCR